METLKFSTSIWLSFTQLQITMFLAWYYSVVFPNQFTLLDDIKKYFEIDS